MNKILFALICFGLAACNNDYAKEKQELLLDAKHKAAQLIDKNSTELIKFSEYLSESKGVMIGSDYYEAYLYAKNNISQAEADKGRKTDNNELFQLDKLAYTLGIIGINITDDSNLITFVTSKTVNSNYVFNYFIVDLTFGENNIDFSYCDELGNYCKVSEEGRWLQVYSFQNIEKLNKYNNVNVN